MRKTWPARSALNLCTPRASSRSLFFSSPLFTGRPRQAGPLRPVHRQADAFGQVPADGGVPGPAGAARQIQGKEKNKKKVFARKVYPCYLPSSFLFSLPVMLLSLRINNSVFNRSRTLSPDHEERHTHNLSPSEALKSERRGTDLQRLTSTPILSFSLAPSLFF